MSDPTRDPDAAGALSHLRVLDLTSARAAYAGKLLADLGADVIKLEPPGGDPAREEPPRLADGTSAAFVYENAGKRSVVLDLDSAPDAARFRSLVADADLVVESFAPGQLARRSLAPEALLDAHPRLVWTSISGFGQSGPRAGCRSNDLVASAEGGAMTTIGDPEDPPVRLAAHQADVITATLATASSLVALHHRDRSGRGQHVDVSALEVVAAITHIAGVGKWLEDGVVPKRVGTGLVASVPSGAYACKDGLVYLMVNRPAHWVALASWIHEVTGNEEVLLDEFRGPSSARLPYRELLDVFIGDLTATLTVDEAYHEGQRRHIAFTPVNDARRLFEDEQLRARDFFREVARPDGGSLSVPGAPYRPARTPWRIAGPAPALDAHADDVLGRPRAAPRPLVAQPSGGRDTPFEGALAGLRVVEFGAGLAAPWIGRILAWAGADVIKVESHAHPDVPRLYVSPREPERGTQPECSPWFTDWSAGKRFVALDLRNEAGAELARRLVDESDAMISNYSTGVLEKLGLGYARLAERNPGLVALESNGYGESGPLARYVTWGPNIEALAGLCRFTGFPHRDCTISHFAYPDPLSALHGLVVLMAALAERDRSGRGQQIHLSQYEATVAAAGRALVDPTPDAGATARIGNREPGRAPYGAFPCRGDDRWVVLCVEQESDWPRFQTLLGRTGVGRVVPLCEHARPGRAPGRARGADRRVELDARGLRDRGGGRVGSGWPPASSRPPRTWYHRDEQLAARGFFETILHHKRGHVTATGIPLGLTGTPGHTTRSGASVGHDNRVVFGDVLGLTAAEIDDFVRRGAIEAP